jgi:hypothetical protein
MSVSIAGKAINQITVADDVQRGNLEFGVLPCRHKLPISIYVTIPIETSCVYRKPYLS